MLTVVRIMKSNKVAIEKTSQDIFSNMQNPEEIACGETVCKKNPIQTFMWRSFGARLALDAGTRAKAKGDSLGSTHSLLRVELE